MIEEIMQQLKNEDFQIQITSESLKDGVTFHLIDPEGEMTIIQHDTLTSGLQYIEANYL